MSMRFKPTTLSWIFAICLLACLGWIATAEAQDIGTNQSNDMNSPVGGNIAGGDQLAVGFSSPSFGAAVGQCVGTEAANWMFGLYGKQDMKVNYWCMGSSLYQMGKYQAAARVWCERTELGSLYPTIGECQIDLSAPPETLVAEPVEVVETYFDELEEMHAAEIEEQQMLLADMQAKIENLEQSKVIIQQVPFIDDKKRAALEELKK